MSDKPPEITPDATPGAPDATPGAPVRKKKRYGLYDYDTPRHLSHGLSQLINRRGKITPRGWNALDKRSRIYKDSIAWTREHIADLGGEENLSASQRYLVDVNSRTKLFLDSADAYIAQYLREHGSLVDAEHKLIPIVAQRQAIVDSLTKSISLLGLKRVIRPKTLSELLDDDEPEPEQATTAKPTSRTSKVADTTDTTDTTVEDTDTAVDTEVEKDADES